MTRVCGIKNDHVPGGETCQRPAGHGGDFHWAHTLRGTVSWPAKRATDARPVDNDVCNVCHDPECPDYWRAKERWARATDACPSCGGDAGDNWFDRSICPCDDTMHTRCVKCGLALDGCKFEHATGTRAGEPYWVPLWSRAVIQAAETERSEPAVFADLIEQYWRERLGDTDAQV